MFSRQLMGLLMKTDSQSIQTLVKIALSEMCQLTNTPSALLFLADGTRLTLKYAVNIPNEIELGISIPIPHDAELTLNENENVRPNSGLCKLLWPLTASLKNVGFKSHICSPLLLKSDLIGIVELLSKTQKEFSQMDFDLILAESKTLALKLHHIIFFPEYCAEWIDAVPVQNNTVLKSLPLPENISRKSRKALTVFEFAVGQNVELNSEKHRTLGESLPKGISLMTLRRICDVLPDYPGIFLRRDLAVRLGISEITTGKYLAYLTERVVLEATTSTGHMGRPAFLYKLSPKVRAAVLGKDG